MKRIYLLLLLLAGVVGQAWAQADLTTTVSGPRIAQVGTTVTYNLTLFNNGPNVGTVNSYTVQLVPGLNPTGATPVTASGNYRGNAFSFSNLYNNTTGTLYYNFSTFDLNPAEQLLLNVTFTMPGSTVTGKVSLTTSTTDPNPANNNGSSTSANITTQSTANATFDLETTAGGPATVNVGQPATFQVLTVNNGDGTATNVVQVIQLPQIGGSYPAAADVTVSSGSYNAGTGRATFGTVASLPVGLTNRGGVTNYVTFVPRATAASVNVTGSGSSTPIDLSSTNNSQTVALTITTLGGTGSAATACANPGRDGNVTNLAVNPDTYYYPALGTVANAGSGNTAATAITLQAARSAGTATAIAAGDLLLIIQMQGSAIDSDNDDTYGSGVAGNPGNGYLNDANFRAGRFEYAVAASAVPTSGGTLVLAAGLANTYERSTATSTQGQRSFQIIRVPQYGDLTLAATIKPLPWNGRTGGVLVLDVAGAFNPASFGLNADGLGFRGGAGRQMGGDGGGTALLATDFRSSAALNANGTKGEGLAGMPRYLNDPTYSTTVPLDTRTTVAGFNSLLNATLEDGYPGGDNGRGAPGNAGGGGTDGNPSANDQNSGGSGGANGGSGGRGGNSWNSNLLVGGEPSFNFGQAAANRLVMGGGGGSGTTNNGTNNNAGFNTSGAVGGGIILVRTGSVTGTGTLSANGASASNDVGNDGAGGGGAGGSILVTARVTSGLSTLTLTANGGDGGTMTTPNAHGPGGGGGGGILLSNGAVAGTSVAGGVNGRFKTSNTDAGIPFGADPGSNGYSNTSIGTNVLTNSTTGSSCIADVYTTITGPATAAAGQPAGVYQATFGNQGALAASTVVRQVALPAGASLTAAQRATIVGSYPGTTFSTTGTGSSAVTTIDFGTLAMLAAGASNVFNFSYTAPATAGTYATGSSTSTTTGTPAEGGLLANNTASVSTLVAPAADVTVSLTGPTTLSAGQPTGTFTATFTNEGPQSASSVTRSVTLPTGATLSTAQRTDLNTRYGLTAASYTTNGSGQTVINFGTTTSAVLPGGSSAFTFAFTAPATAGSTFLTGNTSTATPEGNNLAPNSASLIVTTTEMADMQAVIAAGAASYTPGTTGTFTATFTNNGPTTASGVAYTVQLPAGLSGVVAGNSGSYNATTGLVTYPSAATTLASTGTFTSSITFTMPATGPVVATAATVSTTPETSRTNNVASTSTDAAQRQDLTTTLSGPGTVTGGSPMTLSVTTTNSTITNGSLAVGGVKERVKLVTGLSDVFVSGSGYYNGTTSAVTGGFVNGNFVVGNPGDTIRVAPGWVVFPAIATLPQGQTVTNTITFMAPAGSFAPAATVTPNTGAAGETITTNNVAYLNGAAASTNVTVSGSTTAANSANVYTTVSLTAVNGSAITPATATTVTSTAATPATVTYSVVSGNQGAAGATGVVQRLQLLPGLGVANVTVSGSGTYDNATGLITWPTQTTVASGSSTTYTVTAPVPVSVGAVGQLLATASVSSTSPDNVPADNVMAATVTVRPTTDLATTVVGPASAVPGQQVVYVASFTNNGPSPVASVAETMQLPIGLAGVSITDASGTAVTGASYNAATGVLTLPAVTANAVGAVQTFLVSFAAPAQSFAVSSGVTGNTPETTTTNNAATRTTTVTPAADVAVAVSGPAVATGSNPVTYTVSTTNNGPNPATGVVTTLQLPTFLGVGNVTIVGGGTYDDASGVVTFPSTSLVPGASAVYAATFIMPDQPAGGYVSGLASVTTTSTDPVRNNNSAGVTTAVAPGTADIADLEATIPTSPAAAVTAGSTASYGVRFRNLGTGAAVNATPVVYLPAGLSGVTVVDGSGAAVPGASYNATTGVLTLPVVNSMGSGAILNYTVGLTVPASGPITVAAAISSVTTDAVTNNNAAAVQTNVTAKYDATTALKGPDSSLPGTANTYTVTTLNNGPSTAPSVTQEVRQLPLNLGVADLLVNGQTGTLTGGVINYTGATYTQNTGVLAFTPVSNLEAGPASAVTNTFTLTMPATGSLSLLAVVTSAGESSTGNNQDTQATARTNQPPVANNVVNSLQNARGNTAAALKISPLVATDPDGAIAATNGYTIVGLPPTSQGTLYYNGTAAGNAVTAGQTITDPSQLYFKPASGFVGDAFFTYSATDNAATPLASNVARYTIPVARDQSTTYATYNAGKGGSNPYQTGDVLAQTQDPNTARYNSAGLLFNAATGAAQTGTDNGLTSATIVTGSLPAGVSIDPVTGRIYVSNASLLPRVTTATPYTVTVRTVDLNGGTNDVPVTFTLGAFPLPVQLVEFTAQAVHQDARLNWVTASELNNDHFDVERSLDGVSFTGIGQVAGQGSKTTATTYGYLDAGIGSRVSGPVYYRLKQVDRDGTSTYSPVRTVSFAAPAGLSLYPNPATAAATLDLRSLPATSTYAVTLLDLTGRLVSRQQVPGGQLSQLDLSTLASGTYVVQVQGDNLRHTQRLTRE